MNFTVMVWRQEGPKKQGRMETHKVSGITEDTSFLEMLDILNEELIEKGEEPIAFDHDCREGICGACSLHINGVAHGPENTTTCQLHMRSFDDGDTIVIEPFRARAFPVIKDLVVDRSGFERIIEAGGYVSVGTGGAPDANALPIAKDEAEEAFDAAACIGCGACVAACKNASAMLFTSAKVSQFTHLPQGEPERHQRVVNMVKAMDDAGFGNCTNYQECEAVCPKQISIMNIHTMNREYVKAKLAGTSATA
ncbi:Fumarate reductase iron-sulfur subunit [Planctomycetes bacterium Pan216]|uniref:Fumarate reductase iron-sulfur subunit n=1 Tax=Kolteria novifilia TaxID=2527975 RepID=A0A518B884_9BACT|nr:Fumarate reductase iron-sulfur subunit [Planctomycetes bacterium Pan216]